MEKISIAVVAGLIVLFAVWAGCLLGAAGGALAGWIVSFVFDDTFHTFFTQMGLPNIALWQYGAFIGFTGGFFRSPSSSKS